MKMTIELTELLFQKMLIHYSNQLPEDKNLRDIIKIEYYDYLKDYEAELVSKNFREHVKKYPRLKPAIADLIKNDTIYYSVPSVEETRLMIENKEKENPDIEVDRNVVKEMLRKHKEKMAEERYNEYKRNITESKG